MYTPAPAPNIRNAAGKFVVAFIINSETIKSQPFETLEAAIAHRDQIGASLMAQRTRERPKKRGCNRKPKYLYIDEQGEPVYEFDEHERMMNPETMPLETGTIDAALIGVIRVAPDQSANTVVVYQSTIPYTDLIDIVRILKPLPTAALQIKTKEIK